MFLPYPNLGFLDMVVHLLHNQQLKEIALVDL